MTEGKKVIHIVKHQPTGAMVPVIVRKVDENNIITDYYEYTEKRKGFTLEMLKNRWDKTREDVLELLQSYKIPAFVKHTDVQALDKGMQPVDAALFFEEYVYALEKKTSLPHKKLKSKKLNNNDLN